jgi:hypothetical protein
MDSVNHPLLVCTSVTLGAAVTAKMTKYSHEPEDTSNVVKARGTNLRVHFKNTRETAKAIKGMSVSKAKGYLKDVIDHKRCIVFRRFCGGIGRTPLAKNEGSTNGQVCLCCDPSTMHICDCDQGTGSTHSCGATVAARRSGCGDRMAGRLMALCDAGPFSKEVV